jgi:GMP synthase PP-ATPase subunit
MSEKAGPRELFATPEDIITAHQLVEDGLGQFLDVSYMAMPKSSGVLGDEGVHGHTVVISAFNEQRKQAVYEDIEQLAKVALQITAATRSAARVLFDITPGGSFFRAEPPSS